jgi:riboflavin synthase
VFTGLVEERGRVAVRDGARLRVRADLVVEDAKVGDSVAVNGCCLTVVDVRSGELAFDVVDESYARTNLGDLAEGHPVNLERPVRPTDRLGGHIVQGHVDAVGEVVTPAPDLYVRTDPALLRYVVEKGSIAVDGISLTVVEVRADGFTVAVIPHTAEVTTLGSRRPGDRVNLEVDLMAKYAEKLLDAHREPR